MQPEKDGTSKPGPAVVELYLPWGIHDRTQIKELVKTEGSSIGTAITSVLLNEGEADGEVYKRARECATYLFWDLQKLQRMAAEDSAEPILVRWYDDVFSSGMWVRMLRDTIVVAALGDSDIGDTLQLLYWLADQFEGGAESAKSG